MKAFVIRGALAGLAGSAVSTLVLLLVGEPAIGRAIDLEHGGSATHDEMFSRTVQTAGGALGLILVGLCLGTAFGVVFAATRHRLPGARDDQRGWALAALAFGAVVLVPFMKYPANPPAVGDPSTVGRRTLLYLCMVAWAITATVATVRLVPWLRGRIGSAAVAPVAAIAWTVLVIAAWVTFPTTPMEIDIPATLLWRFRLASIGGQAGFWAATGLAFGWLGSVLRTATPRQAAPGTGTAEESKAKEPIR